MMPIHQVQFGGAKPVTQVVPEMTELDTDVTHSLKKSFINVLHGNNSDCPTIKVNFRKMVNPKVIENSDFELLIAADKAMQHKYVNSLVGFFVGLEQGPWLIRNIPIILTKWSPNMTLSKDEVTRVPVWVKMPVKVRFIHTSADGYLIASQIRNLISLDALTSAMCVEAWGRIGFARAFIKVSADKELKQEVIMAIPKGEDVDAGHTMVKIQVEYEWKPPLCIDCHVFGHTADQCPKKVIDKPITPVVVSDDGFTTVVNRRSKGKGATTTQMKHVGGFKSTGKENTKEGENNGIKLKNLFEKLNEITSIVDPDNDTGEIGMTSTSDATSHHNDDSESEVESFCKDNPINLCLSGQSYSQVHRIPPAEVTHV
ncbi:trichome birefringence-like protein 3 [Tanacetum coccineum]